MGKRGRACRGDRRGVVHRGRGLANGLARRSEAGARPRAVSTRIPPSGKRHRRFVANVSPRDRRRPRVALGERRASIAKRASVDASEVCLANIHPNRPVLGRVVKVSPSRRTSDASNAIFPNAPDTLARRGTFLSRRVPGVTDGARAGTGARGPARPRSPPSLIEDRLRASPLPAARSVARVPPRVPRVPRPRIFADRARPPLDRPDRRDRPPINPPRPDRLAGEISRRPLSETLLSCHARQFS